MKKSLLICIMLIMGISANSYAQRKQKTVEFKKQTELTMLSGQMTYGYIVDEDGNFVKDGPISINCKDSDSFTVNYYSTCNWSGNYTLNANHENGLLNGTAKSNYRYVASVDNKSEEYIRTFSGSFKNGLPNGTFEVSYIFNGKNQIKQTTNYKNGKLVGAYYYDGFDEDGISAILKGSLDEQGRLIGNWKISTGAHNRNVDMQFQKGVLISKTTEDLSTKPSLVELSKKYANGQITKEQLAEKRIYIAQDSLQLGKYARIGILDNSYFEFGEMSGWDFSETNTIKYEYLVELAMLTQKGFDKLIEYIDEVIFKDNDDMHYSFNINGGVDDKYRVISEDENGYCIYFNNKDHQKEHSKGSLESRYVYLTEEQMSHLDSVFEVKLVNNAKMLYDFIVEKYNFDINDIDITKINDFCKIGEEIIKMLKTPYTGNENYMLFDDEMIIYYMGSIAGHRGAYTTMYFTKESVDGFAAKCDEMEREFEITLINDAKMLYDFIVEKNKYDIDVNDITKLSEIRKIGEEIIKKLKTSYTGNENYMLFDDEMIQYSRYHGSIYEGAYTTMYFTKESVDGFAAKCDEMERELEKRILEKQIKEIEGICNYMVEQKTSTSISYDEKVTKYFDPAGLDPEYWRLDLGKLIKPFCKIEACKVISYDNSTGDAVLEITKLISKKKGCITYRLPVIVKNKKIVVKSIDFSKATVVEQ